MGRLEEGFKAPRSGGAAGAISEKRDNVQGGTINAMQRPILFFSYYVCNL